MSTHTQDGKTNLLGLDRTAMESFFVELGEKPFRARQVMQWIYGHGVADFDAMTDLSKSLRERLPEIAEVRPPTEVTERFASDGTRKWVLAAGGGQAIETVFIPEEKRNTLCISSQVGCVLDCAFCSTGHQGFNRNLSTAEIVGQVWLAKRELDDFGVADRQISNVVLMGMGEPLANYRNVLPALRIFLDDYGMGLSRRRVTLSTSGLVPQISRLAEDCAVALAVSLHAADDEVRDRIVPINRRHPIAELLAACWRYSDIYPGRDITFEYVMLDGVNDSDADARRLAALLRDRPAKVNLIPFNPFPGTSFICSPPDRIAGFRDRLYAEGIRTMVRRTRGQDIDAACGQLAGRVSDRVKHRLGSRMISVATQPRTEAR